MQWFFGTFLVKNKSVFSEKSFLSLIKKIIILHCGNPKTRGPSHSPQGQSTFSGQDWYWLISNLFYLLCIAIAMMGPTIAIMLWCLSRWYFVVSFYFEQELTSNRTVIRHTATHWEIWIQKFSLLYQFTCNININIH